MTSDAITVLNSLGSQHNTSVDGSEQEALNLVWRAIQDELHRDNLIETLVKQLASGVENGVVVCSTGKITRILSVLDTVGDSQKTRPMWVLREEISVIAGRIRQTILEKLGEDVRKAYEDGKQPIVEDAMKRAFREEVKKVYCGGLGLKPEIVEPIIQQFEEGF